MSAPNENQGRKATLLGMVMPSHGSSGEDGLELYLSAGDGQEYFLEKNSAGLALKEFVYERVMVHGMVIPGEHEHSLLVEKFEPWQQDEDDDYYGD